MDLSVTDASFGNPLLDGAGLRGNVHSDLDEILAFLEFVRKHVAFVDNLLERILCSACAVGSRKHADNYSSKASGTSAS